MTPRKPKVTKRRQYRITGLLLLLCTQILSLPAQAALVSAILPTSRSAQLEAPITVFATVINSAATTANNCLPALGSAIDASMVHQTTNPATNQPTGVANAAVDILAQGSQSYILEITTHAPFEPTDVVVDFICDNADTPFPLVGINTLLLSSSADPTADIVALAATVDGAGTLTAQEGSGSAFSVASFNVGATANVTVTPRAQGAPLDALSICETDPATGACLNTAAASVTLSIPQNGTPTFSVFMQNNTSVGFDPAGNRISVRFTEAGIVRGSTSVAVRVDPADSTEPTAPVDPVDPAEPTDPVDPIDPVPAPVPTSTPPNILFIISDDLGLDASNQYLPTLDGPTTPVLDQLANNGLIFDNAWAMPSCAPTRATLLTGEFGVTNGVSETPGRLDLSTQILQRVVEENTSYETAVFGKWHLAQGNSEPNHPNDLGVGHYAGNLAGNVGNYFNWDLTTNGQVADETEYNTTKLTSLAIDWISEQDDPWFVWMAYIAPHSPFHLPPANLQSSGLPGGQADIDANERAYFLASIEAMDTEIGRLIDSLPPAERDNTLIIYMGDNGTPRGIIDTRVFDSTHAKSSLYQGGVGVPMLVSGAGVTRTGEREAALINTTDLFATVSELAGIETTVPSTSQSFAPLLSDASAASRTHNYAQIEGNNAAGWTTRDSRYKLIVFNNGSEELYDLDNDPDEANNLIDDASLSSVRDELHAYGLMIRG